MKKWLIAFRGGGGMGVPWAAVWGLAGALVGLITGGIGIDLGYVIFFSIIGATLGLIGGSVFSEVLGLVERHRSLGEMSLPRFGIGGALAALPSVLIWWGLDGYMPPLEVGMVAVVLALTGAGSAAGSLALARIADDRGLVDVGADVPNKVGPSQAHLGRHD